MPMSFDPIKKALLASYETHGGINHLDGANLPSEESVNRLASDLMHVLFPGFFEQSPVTRQNVDALIERRLAEISARLTPSYFPFTEPSGQVDISCPFCQGRKCAICKQTGWIELGGCGMVDPNVFDAVGYDREKYTGFAFGMGIERMVMAKHGIPDLRLLFENDVRFVRQC